MDLITRKDRDLQQIFQKLERHERLLEKILRILEKLDTHVSPELEAEIKQTERIANRIDEKVED